MKIFAILRGFPGLGRVISGVELLKHFEKENQAEIKLVTYFKGIEYIKTNDLHSVVDVHEKDVSSIGIIPVSESGEAIIREIIEFKPDVLIIDGEPLMIYNLKNIYPNLKIVSLLNPFDVNNPHNQESSSKFFLSMFSHADISIVHGLWNENKPEGFDKYISVNSIVRNSIPRLVCNQDSNNIVCLLGGGSKSNSSAFLESTFEIAMQVLNLSNLNKHFKFRIHTSDDIIKNKLLEYINSDFIKYCNVSIFSHITSEIDLYSDAKLVIARAGRNTISELLAMNMPSIIIPTSANFRGSEQMSNCCFINSLDSNIIKTHALEDKISSLNEKFNKILTNIKDEGKKFKSGNKEVVRYILENVN